MTISTFFNYYLVLIFLGIIFFFFIKRITHKTDLHITLFFIILTSILMSVRPLEVADTTAYFQAYNRSEFVQMENFIIGTRYLNMEYLFVLTMKIFVEFNFSFEVFMFFMALVTYCTSIYSLNVLNKYISKSTEDNYLLIWIIYMLYFAAHYGGIAIRAGLSMGIGLLGVSFFIRERRIIGIALILLASSFQSMALVFIPIIILFYMIPRISKDKLMLLWLLMFGLLITNISGRLVGAISSMVERLFFVINLGGFAHYLNIFDITVGKKDIYVLVLFGMLIIISYNRIVENQRLSLIAFSGLITLCFLYPVNSINRVYDYFLLFIIPVSSVYLGKLNFLTYKKLIYILLLGGSMVIQYINCFGNR